VRKTGLQYGVLKKEAAGGGVGAMIFLVPHLTLIGGLMCVVFLGALASA
jgi:hypothetical protein